MHDADHLAAGLARLHAMQPGFLRRLEYTQGLRQGTRRQIPELMTADATHVLHPHEIAIAAARQGCHLRLVGNIHHRVPVSRRIGLCRRGGIGCDEGGQIEGLAGAGRYLGRVGEAVAARPYAVFRLGKLGQKKPAGVVGHDDLRESCRKILRFGDDPNTGFGAAGARNRAADTIGRERLVAPHRPRLRQPTEQQCSAEKCPEDMRPRRCFHRFSGSNEVLLQRGRGN